MVRVEASAASAGRRKRARRYNAEINALRTGIRAIRAEPEIDRPLDDGSKGQRDALSRPRRSIGGQYDFEHSASILARHDWARAGLHAADEMLQLLGVALVERFLKR